MIASDSVMSASRRLCVTMILPGSESSAVTPMYKVDLSNSTRTSVRSEAGAPSIGSVWMKFVYGSTPSHASSVTLPSITGGGEPSASGFAGI